MKINIFLLFFLFVNNAVSSVSTNSILVGEYFFTQQGDELINGQKASITWNIFLKDEKSAVVSISSYHAPFNCDGLYNVFYERSQIILKWSGELNKDSSCDVSAPQIILKKSSSGSVLIHSELFPWDSSGWKKLKEKNKM